MKTLRKSLNVRDTQRLQISTPLQIQTSKPSTVPQKVIRAIGSSRTTSPQQLPFQKGDFFYVTAHSDTDSPWYEAHNPVTGARGLVPKDMFEEFLKNPPPSVILVILSRSGPHIPSASGPPTSPSQHKASPAPSLPPSSPRHASSMLSSSTTSSQNVPTSLTPKPAIQSPSSPSPIANGSSLNPSAGSAVPVSFLPPSSNSVIPQPTCPSTMWMPSWIAAISQR